MPRRILIIQGHPDPRPERFCRALAQAYADAARVAGHELRTLDVAQVDVPLLRRREDWDTAPPTPAVVEAQDAIRWAEHLLIVHPLWLGAMPAALKALLEQVCRPGFAIGAGESRKGFAPLLKGRSAHVVVTMGMPALVYRWFFRAHGLKALTRNILAFCGIRPIRTSLVGTVEGSPRHRERWLARMAEFGRAGA